MLPNFKIVIGGILFAIVLLAVTGVGLVTPDTYTRVGDAPEVSRPMTMQQMIGGDPGQQQLHILMLTRRNEEIDRLRERTEGEIQASLVIAERNDAKAANEVPAVLAGASGMIAGATVPTMAFVFGLPLLQEDGAPTEPGREPAVAETEREISGSVASGTVRSPEVATVSAAVPAI